MTASSGSIKQVCTYLCIGISDANVKPSKLSHIRGFQIRFNSFLAFVSI